MRILLTVIMALFVIGCATVHRPVKVYSVQGYTLIIAEPDDVQKMSQGYDQFKGKQVRGYFDPWFRLMVVPYQAYEDQPEFFILGHETWHLTELGGNFHY